MAAHQSTAAFYSPGNPPVAPRGGMPPGVRGRPGPWTVPRRGRNAVVKVALYAVVASGGFVAVKEVQARLRDKSHKALIELRKGTRTVLVGMEGKKLHTPAQLDQLRRFAKKQNRKLASQQAPRVGIELREPVG